MLGGFSSHCFLKVVSTSGRTKFKPSFTAWNSFAGMIWATCLKETGTYNHPWREFYDWLHRLHRCRSRAILLWKGDALRAASGHSPGALQVSLCLEDDAKLLLRRLWQGFSFSNVLHPRDGQKHQFQSVTVTKMWACSCILSYVPYGVLNGFPHIRNTCKSAAVNQIFQNFPDLCYIHTLHFQKKWRVARNVFHLCIVNQSVQPKLKVVSISTAGSAQIYWLDLSWRVWVSPHH